MSIPSKELLNELYWKKGLSLPKIGRMFHVHYITVRNWLVKYGIPRRKKGERADAWTPEEVNILKENLSEPMETLLKLLPKRTELGIYEKIRKFGTSRSIEVFKKRARKDFKLKRDEWIYLAGIIDGEGMLTIDSKKSNLSAKISIVTTSNELANWLKEKLKTPLTISKNKKHPEYREKYEFFVHGYETKPFLEKILPFLIVKKRNAELLIEFINMRLSRSTHAEHLKGEKALLEQIRKLNRGD